MNLCDIHGGGHKKPPKKKCTCHKNLKWEKMVKKRKKTTIKLTNTNSYVPRNALTARKRIYFIHDNGGRPFKFVADNTGIKIFTYPEPDLNDPEWYKFDPTGYTISVMNIPKFLGYWRGYDTSPYMMHGNSILVHLGPKRYVFVGLTVIQFTTNDVILDYVSYVGNNDVPYPIAYGVDNIYFILDGAMIRRKILEADIPITVANAEKLYFDGMYGQLAKNKWKYRNFKIKNTKRLIDRR